MTQLISARNNELTPEMEAIALKEDIKTEDLIKKIAEGKIVILKNINHTNVIPIGVGEGLSIKVNANIGTSNQRSTTEEEIYKLRMTEKTGADTVMDLSTGKYIDETRREIIAQSRIPVGTVPIYQAGVEAINYEESILELTKDKIFEAVEKHCRDGVDFITVHCGVTKNVIKTLQEQGRVTGIVSRGGSMLASWITKHQKENPLYEYYDELLEIAKTYDVTISLGDGLRPGCGADAGDRAQVSETVVLGELVNRARKAGVQSMVEGPGHVPLNLIPGMIETIKTLTQGAPLYVLGPLVTDIAPGYDHITAAIGGTLAAVHGADFLCYVTPSEHLGLPDIEQVKQGIVATKIAAHAADVAKGRKNSIKQDLEMSIARKNLDWTKQAQYAIDKDVFENINDGSPCTMCGEYCSMKLVKQYL
ncbi:MAG: phosphomethylpyrimidine synthase [Candidatus Melainabacteria bacterium RIFOXYA12_FULL_32_12]|nr:MAG: phosphomethylpyrimidine synthase [Candidatus Melainabacteria bacterium RIFOXYA2_FULL_32_9]OGI29920.1 MAG: phosphomethylpyrimidine synthase [Candidatus Melainabacteria bacterium RIFOXYA12_FULL_32_12]